MKRSHPNLFWQAASLSRPSAGGYNVPCQSESIKRDSASALQGVTIVV